MKPLHFTMNHYILHFIFILLGVNSLDLAERPATLRFNKLPSTSKRRANRPTTLDCYIYDEKDEADYIWEIKGRTYNTTAGRYTISPITTPPPRRRQTARTPPTHGIYGSQLKLSFLTLIDKGQYSCIAINRRTKQQYKTSTNVIVVFAAPSTDATPELSSGPQYKCEPYRGTFCPSLDGMSIRVHKHQNQSDIETEVRRISSMFQHEAGRFPECSKYVVQATCYYIYDVCRQEDNTLDPANVLKLCRQDCELLTHHHCKTPFENFQNRVGTMQFTTLINCTKLAKSEDQCLPTGMENPINATQKCYTTKLPGKLLDTMVHQSKAKSMYFGLASTDRSGNVCETWNDKKLLQNYPLELAGGHNYCRAINPAGLVSIKNSEKFNFNQPWCFVRRGVEFHPASCTIDSCSPIIAGLTTYLPILLLVAAGVLFTLIVTLVCCCCKCRNNRHNKTQKTIPDANTVAGSFIHQPISSTPGKFSGLQTQLLYHDDSSRSHSSQHMMNTNNTLAKPPSTYSNNSTLAEITPESIERLCEIGDGNFGKVHLAKIVPSHPHYQPKQPVLVKTIDSDSIMDDGVEAEFIKELQNRAELRHANLICLKAYVKQQRICCLVYEYTEWSTLHKTLVASRLGVGAAGVPTHLNVTNFPYIIRQIADVMSYLEDKGYTHRDLAARNIMIMNNEFHVKIASLGMMRRDYMTDYAKLNWLQEMPFAMPLRWMAPESLQYGKFTIASDVWSFGIVLWEMFSFGNRPWAEFSNDQVIELVAQRGQTLHRPQDCPENVYKLMNDCWNTTPEHRPTFEQLKNKFMANELFEVAMSHVGGSSSMYSNPQQYRQAPNSPIAGGTHSQIMNENSKGFIENSSQYITSPMAPLLNSNSNNNSNNSGNSQRQHSGQRASSSYSDYSPKSKLTQNSKKESPQIGLLSYHTMSDHDNIQV